MAHNQPINNSLHLTFKRKDELAKVHGTSEFVRGDITDCLTQNAEDPNQDTINNDCIILYYIKGDQPDNLQSRIINYQSISDLYGWGPQAEGAPVKNRSYEDFKKANLMVNFLDVIKDGNGTIRPNNLSTLGMYNNDLIGSPPGSETAIKELRDKWEKQLMLHAYNLGLLNHFSLDKDQGTSSHMTSVGPSADYLALDAGKPIGSKNGDTSSRSPLFSTWARWADPSSSGNAMDSDAGPHKYISRNLATEDVFQGIDISNLSVTIDEKYYDAMGHGNTFKTHGPPVPYTENGTNHELWKNTKYLWEMDMYPSSDQWKSGMDTEFRTLMSPLPDNVAAPNGETEDAMRKRIHNQKHWVNSTNDAENMAIESFYGGNQEKASAWDTANEDQKKNLL